MLKNRLDIYREACHRCHDWSQSKSPGGCRGRCLCLWDSRDLSEHVSSSYCPAGRYPFAGLGSVLGWIFWKLRLPHLLRWLGWYDPQKCSCAEKQAKLNNIGRRIWRRVWRVKRA